jgi:hypothetical protein
MKKIVVGDSRWSYFLASPYRAFFLEYDNPKVHESRNTIRTLYSRHQKHELRKNESGHACSQRDMLLG